MRRSFASILCAATAALITTANCSEPIDSSEPIASTTSERRSVDGNRPNGSSRELRIFRVSPVDEASELLERLTREPTSAEIRGRLVGIYRNAGYEGVARFFENTMAELKEQPVTANNALAATAWRGTGPSGANPADDIIPVIARLNSDFEFGEAASVAQAHMEHHGVNLQVAAEWAHATIRGTMVIPPRRTTSREFEVAVRILLTGLEETFPTPRAHPNRATGYEELAQVFFASGDVVSSRTAARLALMHLETAPSGTQWSRVAIQQLQDLLRKSGGE